eukprot:gene1539-18276_t
MSSSAPFATEEVWVLPQPAKANVHYNTINTPGSMAMAGTMGQAGYGRHMGVENNGTTHGELGKGQTKETFEDARNNIAMGQSCTAVMGSQVFDTPRHMGIETNGTSNGELGKGQTKEMHEAARSNISLGQSCTAVVGSQVFLQARQMGIGNLGTTTGDIGKGQTTEMHEAARSNISLGQSCTAVVGSQVFDDARHMGIEHTKTTHSDLGGFYQKRTPAAVADLYQKLPGVDYPGTHALVAEWVHDDPTWTHVVIKTGYLTAV